MSLFLLKYNKWRTLKKSEKCDEHNECCKCSKCCNEISCCPIIKQGLTGATGPFGVTGPSGIFGPTGITGAVGFIGPVAITGEFGITGPFGAIGIFGMTGAIGATGANGVTGDQGLIGKTGDIGPNGIDTVGPIGNTGPKGITGTNDLESGCITITISADPNFVSPTGSAEIIYTIVDDIVTINSVGNADIPSANVVADIRARTTNLPHKYAITIIFPPTSNIRPLECLGAAGGAGIISPRNISTLVAPDMIVTDSFVSSSRLTIVYTASSQSVTGLYMFTFNAKYRRIPPT